MATPTPSIYDQQAADFVARTGLKITSRYEGHRPYFDGDKDSRAVWLVTFSRAGKPSHTFRFGQSISASYKPAPKWSSTNNPIPVRVPPSAYDLLACIEKNDVGTFEEWASEYGYDTDSRKALTTYLACQKQAHAIARLFNEEELNALREIQ